MDASVPLNLKHFRYRKLIDICIGFLRNEATRKDVNIRHEYLGVPRIMGDELQLMRVYLQLVAERC
jgi:hypothetical protein